MSDEAKVICVMFFVILAFLSGVFFMCALGQNAAKEKYIECIKANRPPLECKASVE